MHWFQNCLEKGHLHKVDTINQNLKKQEWTLESWNKTSDHDSPCWTSSFYGQLVNRLELEKVIKPDIFSI